MYIYIYIIILSDEDSPISIRTEVNVPDIPRINTDHEQKRD